MPQIVTSATALLEDVLKSNGEEHLYNMIMGLSANVEEEPLMIFEWRNVPEFLQAIQMAQAEAAAPGGVPLPVNPLGLPAAVNVQNFKEAVLEYARVEGAFPRLDTTCLPCTFEESIVMGGKLIGLELNPWTQRIMGVGVVNALPIASVYVPRPDSSILDRVLHRPNSLWG